MFPEIPYLVLFLGLVSCAIDMDTFYEEIVRPNLNNVKSAACRETPIIWASLCNEAFKCLKEAYADHKYSLFPRYYCFNNSEEMCSTKSVFTPGTDYLALQNLMSCYDREKIISGITMDSCKNHNKISIYPINYDKNNTVNVLWVFKKRPETHNFDIFHRCEIKNLQHNIINEKLLGSMLPFSVTNKDEIERILSEFLKRYNPLLIFRNNILERVNSTLFFQLCHFVLKRPRYNVHVPPSLRFRKQSSAVTVAVPGLQNLQMQRAYVCYGFTYDNYNWYRLVAVAEESLILVLKEKKKKSKIYELHELIYNLNELYFGDDHIKEH